MHKRQKRKKTIFNISALELFYRFWNYVNRNNITNTTKPYYGRKGKRTDFPLTPRFAMLCHGEGDRFVSFHSSQLHIEAKSKHCQVQNHLIPIKVM